MAKFVRKHQDASGSHTVALGETNGKVRELKIEGRNIYSTDDQKEIKLLRNDEMVEEVDPKAMIESKED